MKNLTAVRRKIVAESASNTDAMKQLDDSHAALSALQVEEDGLIAELKRAIDANNDADAS